MSIIIPSQSIYEINNPKVLKNQYDKVEINATKIEKRNDYDKPVLTTSTDMYSYGTEIQADKFEEQVDSSGNNWERWYSFIRLQPMYSQDIKFTIPKFFDNNFVQKLLTGKNDKGENNIKFTVYSDKYIGAATSQYPLGYVKTTYGKPTGSTDEIKINISHSYTHDAQGLGPKTVTATLDFNNLDNVGTATFTEDSKNFYITLTILTGYERVTLGGYSFTIIDENTKPFPISGECIKYIPKKIEITFYGNTLGIDIENETITVGDESGKNLLHIGGNELLQTDNTIKQSIGSPLNAIDTQYTDTLNGYAHGKETATIRCSIKDYYDSENKLVISANQKDNLPMVFMIGDIVRPMVRNANGKDVPMSINSDGTAKEFVVVGTKLQYDGAVWQELSLQEYY